ncbi:MAG: diphthine--ammonia ligase [Chloroflexota bacterium]
MKVVVSWSGGKDSCLASFLAQEQGHELAYLLNMSSVEFRRSSGHGIALELISCQSEALSIPLVQGQFTRQDSSSYEKSFKENLSQLKERGVKGVVSGDIHLPESKEWIARVCDEVGLETLTPLWGMEVETVITQFIDLSFEALVVTTKADLMGPEWLGRSIDKVFVTDLPRLAENVDLCGERGEFHTFVTNGPLFHKKIKVLSTDRVFRESPPNGYWFLDIKQYEVVAK